MTKQAMTHAALTIGELHNPESGAWFSKLSTALRTAIVDRARVRRLCNAESLAVRGPCRRGWPSRCFC